MHAALHLCVLRFSIQIATVKAKYEASWTCVSRVFACPCNVNFEILIPRGITHMMQSIEALAVVHAYTYACTPLSRGHTTFTSSVHLKLRSALRSQLLQMRVFLHESNTGQMCRQQRPIA